MNARIGRTAAGVVIVACVGLIAVPAGTATPAGGNGEAAVDSAVVLAAGDIADCGSPHDEETAALLDSVPGLIVALGDNAYYNGTRYEYAKCYDPSWGRHRARTRPTPGNHDYRTAGAAAYYEYFGAQAGENGRGYYSYDLGSWHVVVLNSNIASGEDSEQVRWLRADLAARSGVCTLAYFHHPRFSSADKHGNQKAVAALWDALYEGGVEIVLGGHDHTYERFAPQRPDGLADAERGIRECVVGTGGHGANGFGAVQPNSEARSSGVYGVLKLVLRSADYSWEFLPAGGARYVDTGTTACH